MNLECNYAAYISGKIYEGLIRAVDKPSEIELKYSSLLSHLILFQHKYEWSLDLQLKFYDKNAMAFMVQRWCHILDRMCEATDYLMYHQHFVIRMMSWLGVIMSRVPSKVMEFLRIKENRMDDQGRLNFVDCFLFSDHTIIKVYGYPQSPHQFPIYVSHRLAFLKFIWKMLWTQKLHLAKQRKGSSIPKYMRFGELAIGC